MITAASAPWAIVFPLINCVYSVTKSSGIRERILIRRTIEIPFPTPFSVIRSPIHIRNALPAVSVQTTIAQFTKLYSSRSPCLPNPTAIAIDSISARATVTYLVIAAIFFLPSSPSFCISSSFGIAIVRSCMIMEDVMYGVILRAKMDILLKEPPVNASKKLNASPVWLAKKS